MEEGRIEKLRRLLEISCAEKALPFEVEGAARKTKPFDFSDVVEQLHALGRTTNVRVRNEWRSQFVCGLEDLLDNANTVDLHMVGVQRRDLGVLGLTFDEDEGTIL